MHINQFTLLNAVTGHPLGHTFSPTLHNAVYEKLGLNAVMLAFPQEDIKKFVEEIRTLPIHLSAVTLPHKLEIMKYLDEIDPVANEIGAVNTVINRKGKLFGYNTDVIGMEKGLEKTNLRGKKTLIVGAGGAARPASWLVKKLGGKLLCVNRTHEKAVQLMGAFGGKALTMNQLKPDDIDIIINCTSVGMSPGEDVSPLPKKLLARHQTVFDLIYNPVETKLLRDAKTAGAKTISGITMLVAQGLEQIRLWSGKTLPPRTISNIEKLLIQALSQ